MPTGNDLYSVRQYLLRQALIGNYILLAPAPLARKLGSADREPIEKLIAWAKRLESSNYTGFRR